MSTDESREGLVAAIKILRKMERDYDREEQPVKAMWTVAYRKAAERALVELK